MYPTYEIKKGVPIPGVSRSDGRGPKYPFAMMDVGDSFDSPIDANAGAFEADRVANRVRTAAAFYRATKAPDKKFALRVIRNGACLVRCWRTA